MSKQNLFPPRPPVFHPGDSPSSRRSSSTSTTSTSTSNIPGPPPIQGNLNSSSSSRNSFSLSHLPASGMWGEPFSNASPHDDSLYSFSPVLSHQSRLRMPSIDTLPTSNGNHALKHDDLVDLDLDGFLRSEHGSIRSNRGRDGLMRQVENSLVTSRHYNTMRRGAMYCAAIILVSLTVGLSVGISVRNKSHGQSHQYTTFNRDPNARLQSCDTTNEFPMDPFWQCACRNAILAYDATVLETYHFLKAEWLMTLIPTFDEKLDSCAPLNIALAWLSADVDQDNNKEIHRDRFLLAFLFAAWKGTNWKNSQYWLSPEHVCDWFGVECDTSKNVVGLLMTENNLVGQFPSELSLLTSLVTMGLANNHISGSIPTEVGTMSALERVTLSVNLLKGTLPDTLGALTALRMLEIDWNELSGSIPSSFGKLSLLEYLSFEDNEEMTGTIPTEIGSMSELKFLTFHNSGITGTIPTEIGNLVHMIVFGGGKNPMRGTLPTELGVLSALSDLDFANSGFTGALPYELSKCTQLITITLSHNQLYSSIPTEFGLLDKLRFLRMNDNRLSGSVPSELAHATLLEHVQLENNFLNGELPTEIGMLSNLKNLNLSNNLDFNGTLPDSVCSLTTEGSLTVLIGTCGQCTCCSDCS